MRDFALSVPPRIPAGDVTLRVYDEGPDDHELIVVRSPARLPMRADGLTVDEDALEHSMVVVLEPTEPGTTTDLHVHLTPGRYDLFCNMSGHFLGGMHAVVVAAS